MILILRLQGPFQSWGERARWEHKDSALYPTKSGVMGLIFNAMGFDYSQRAEMAALASRVAMALRVEKPGRLEEDFQIIQGPLRTVVGGFREDAIIVRKDILHDAEFLVFLEGPPKLLKRFEKGLRRPVRPVYLGRKAFVPTCPVFEQLSDEFPTLSEALDRYPGAGVRCEVESATGPYRRKDVLQPGRTYRSRYTRRYNREVA